MLILDSEVLYGDDSSAPSIDSFNDKLKQVTEIQSERIIDIQDVQKIVREVLGPA